MKSYFVVVIMLIFGSASASWAQNPNKAQNKKAMQKIESVRIGFITERLGLTPDQAQQFWPVYNEFSSKRREIRGRLKDAREDMDPKNLTDEESQRLMELGLEIRQSEVNLEKEYSGRLREVISAQQVLALRKAEGEFRTMILRRIEQQQLIRQRNMQRQQNQRQRGNN